jgi:hypothetical protein
MLEIHDGEIIEQMLKEETDYLVDRLGGNGDYAHECCVNSNTRPYSESEEQDCYDDSGARLNNNFEINDDVISEQMMKEGTDYKIDRLVGNGNPDECCVNSKDCCDDSGTGLYNYLESGECSDKMQKRKTDFNSSLTL